MYHTIILSTIFLTPFQRRLCLCQPPTEDCHGIVELAFHLTIIRDVVVGNGLFVILYIAYEYLVYTMLQAHSMQIDHPVSSAAASSILFIRSWYISQF